MKLKSILLTALLCLLLIPTVHADDSPVKTVASVDLNRYLGKWYEIAAYPMFFQRKCIADTTAEHSLLPDGNVAVNNRCQTENGYDQAKGKAKVVEQSGNARLKVSFFWPLQADYWIIGLDADYQWAVVGHPERKYLWILANKPVLPDEALESAFFGCCSQTRL